MVAGDWRELDNLLDRLLQMPASERRPALERMALPAETVRQAMRLLVHAEGEDALAAVAGDPLLNEALDACADPMLGRMLGDWRIERRLADGGFAEVFEATRAQAAGTQRAALKLLSALHLGGDARQRFESELSILATLSDARIARVYDSGTSETGQPWMALEYIEGAPITRYCEEEGLSIAQRVRLLIELAEAVSHAHRHLVVHRDIKPDNVLVSRDGQLKLLDFGIARPRSVGLRCGVETRPSARLMTPQYASPEQVRGESITTLSDVYQIGLLAHELISGMPPDRSRALAQRSEPGSPPGRSGFVRASHGVSPGPSRWTRWSAQARLLEDLDACIERALQPEPEARHASARAFAEDLQNCLSQEPVRARMHERGYRMRWMLRRHAMVLAIAASLGSTALWQGGSLWLQTRELTRQRDLAETASRNAATIRDYALALIASEDPDSTHADELGEGLLQRGLDEVHLHLADSPALAAELLYALGRTLQRKGEVETAERALSEALELRVRAHGEQDPKTREARAALSAILVQRGRFEAAYAMQAQVLEQLQRVAAPVPEVAAAKVALAHVARRLERYDEAEALLTDALAAISPYSDRQYRLLGNLFSELGTVDFDRGDFASARRRFERALPLMVEHLGPVHVDTLTLKGDLAATLRETGEAQRALGLFDEVILGQRALLGESHPTLAVVLSQSARTLRRLGRVDEALQRWVESERILLAHYGPRHDYTLRVRIAMAEALASQGQHDAALVRVDQALGASVPGTRRNEAMSLRLAIAQAQRGN